MSESRRSQEKYLVFARKWRPQSFEDVIGQEHITRTLQNSIGAGRIGHAFLFIGSRGIGKTTTARILAKALNCTSADAATPNPCGKCDNCQSIAEGNSIDVLEIDGASNNSVEDVREIRDNVRLVPSRSRYKIYIIDEVHQLSMAAFNALLKTLEEPPAHAIFILATTEAQKLPATIISRCQRFDFRRVPIDQIVRLLRDILDKEDIKASEDALFAVARAAEGGIRDAESILDQLVSYCGNDIKFEDVYDVLGLVDWRQLHELCGAVIEKDIAKQLQIIASIVDAGKDLSEFVQEMLRYFRNLLVCKTGGEKNLLALPENEIRQMQAYAAKFTLTNLIRLVEQFAELTKGFDSQVAQRIAIEALLIRISRRSIEMNADAVVEKLMQLLETAPEDLKKNFELDSGPALMNDGGEGLQDGSHVLGAQRVTLTEDNLSEVWPGILAHATEERMSLHVGLDQARPVQIFNDSVVLQFEPAMAEAAKMVQRPDNKQALEKTLADLTANIVSFQCVFNNSEPEPECGGNGARKTLPKTARVSEEDAKTALANPHVAKVVEIFRGRIVEVIKRPEE
jgi:DNA polymerase-3 subunit gamma/tau